MSTNWNDPSRTSEKIWITLLLNVLLASGTSVYVLAFMLEADISSIWCKDDVTNYMFDDYWDNNYQFEFPKLVLARILREVQQVNSVVKCLFCDTPTNFYWNRFIFDRHRARDKLACFFWDTGYINILHS